MMKKSVRNTIPTRRFIFVWLLIICMASEEVVGAVTDVVGLLAKVKTVLSTVYLKCGQIISCILNNV